MKRYSKRTVCATEDKWHQLLDCSKENVPTLGNSFSRRDINTDTSKKLAAVVGKRMPIFFDETLEVNLSHSFEICEKYSNSPIPKKRRKRCKNFKVGKKKQETQKLYLQAVSYFKDIEAYPLHVENIRHDTSTTSFNDSRESSISETHNTFHQRLQKSLSPISKCVEFIQMHDSTVFDRDAEKYFNNQYSGFCSSESENEGSIISDIPSSIPLEYSAGKCDSASTNEFNSVRNLYSSTPAPITNKTFSRLPLIFPTRFRNVNLFRKK